jgi:hypothetical protein
MKWIIILLMPLSLYSQNDDWVRLGLFAGSIVLNAVGDGMNDKGNKDVGHFLNAMALATVLVIPYASDSDGKWYIYLGTYALMRYGLFDCSYNLARGRNMFYQGASGITDKFTGLFPPEVIQFSKLISLGVGITINFTKL